jgi:hypothetical protein
MKRVTYSPRSGDKYRVQIDGTLVAGKDGLLTRAQVLAQGMQLLAEGQNLRISRTSPKNASPTKRGR